MHIQQDQGDEAYKAFLKKMSLDSGMPTQDDFNKFSDGRKAIFFQEIVSTPNWFQSKNLCDFACMIDQKFSKAGTEISKQAMKIFQEAKVAYTSKHVFTREKRQGWISLPYDVLRHTVKYLVSCGSGSLFEENNFAFFKVCKTFRSLRNELFQRNTDQVNQALVGDIFARAQYVVEEIPEEFLNQIRIIGSNRSFTRLPFPILCDNENTLKLFPHLQEVYLIDFINSRTGVSITEEVAKRSLRVLKIEARECTQEHVEEILKNSKASLRTFSLCGSSITDATLRYLANNHPQLREITLNPASTHISTVTDKGFEKLAKLKHLESLRLLDSYNHSAINQTFDSVTERSFSPVIQNLQHLELSLKQEEVIERLLPCLAQCERLSTLQLKCFVNSDDANYIDQHIPTIAGISTLTSLHLSFDGRCSQERIEELGKLSRLCQISCIGWGDNSLRLAPLLSKFQHLETLTIRNAECTEEVTKVLQSLPKFRELHLKSLDYSLPDFQKMSENTLLHIRRLLTSCRSIRKIDIESPLFECGTPRECSEGLRQIKIFKDQIRKMMNEFSSLDVQLYFGGESIFVREPIEQPEEMSVTSSVTSQNQNCIIS